MTTPALIPSMQVPTDYASLGLDDLATIVNREHDLALQYATEAIAHAVCAGEALLAAKEKVPEGEWQKWMTTSLVGSRTQSLRYMRLARHKQLLREERVKTIADAERQISALWASAREEKLEATQDRRDIARAMRKRGESKSAIAEVFGVSTTTVTYWLAPASKRREINAKNQRMWRQALAALRRQERDRQMRRAGGDLAKAYSQIRLLAETLETAAEQSTDSETRTELRDALQRLYRVEDVVVQVHRNGDHGILEARPAAAKDQEPA